eukprot:SM000247S08274  [mRNA]  locus=s247:123641:128515:+ [translate_table: standard]
MPRSFPADGPGGTANGDAVSEYDWDLFTIGIGSGGTRASRISATFGAKVAGVELPFNPISSESEGGVGGTCVLRGCVPKKILVYGSAFRAELEDARGFGWDVPHDIKFDWNKLLTEKTREIQRLNGVYKKLLAKANVTLFEGAGRIIDAHTVEVLESNGETKRHTANHILIATGARAVVLNIPGKEHAITSDEALSLAEQPKRVVIVGAGYIAVEFAGIFIGMGSKVDLIYRKETPLRGFDEELRDLVATNLKVRGVNVHANTNPTKIEKAEDGTYIVHTDKGDSLECDQVMFATGRKPNTGKLGLENVGVELDKIGAIKVNKYSQTNVPSIWAIGDVTNRINLTPVAIMEGMCFARYVFGGDKDARPDYDYVASAVFAQPPLAVVGTTEQEAAETTTGDLHVYTSSFVPMKYSISGRDEKTFLKVLVDSGTDKVLGVCMLGPDSPEIMQSISVAMKCGLTKKQLDSTVGIHPTAAEELVTLRTPTRTIPRGGEARKSAD